MRITREQIDEQVRRDVAAHNVLPAHTRARLQRTIDQMDARNQSLRDGGYYDPEKL